jgi:hypothetical protein
VDEVVMSRASQPRQGQLLSTPLRRLKTFTLSSHKGCSSRSRSLGSRCLRRSDDEPSQPLRTRRQRRRMTALPGTAQPHTMALPHSGSQHQHQHQHQHQQQWMQADHGSATTAAPAAPRWRVYKSSVSCTEDGTTTRMSHQFTGSNQFRWVCGTRKSCGSCRLMWRWCVPGRVSRQVTART